MNGADKKKRFSIEAWLHRIPKVELHVHLEGAIPLPVLSELIRRHGGEPEISDADALRERFRYTDFPRFIDTWIWKNGFLRTCADFAYLAEAVAVDLAEQNIRYAEMFYSPGDFARHGLGVEELTGAIREGLSRVDGVEVALVADLIRDFGPARAATELERLASLKEFGVVGIGIGGSEQTFPPGPFREVYERARELGFRTSAHAGEAAGPESVRAALDELCVDRIGHGTRAAEDRALVERLALEGVPVELCPMSNVRTGVVDSIEDHPAGDFLRAGVRVSVNSDDPKMFQTSVADEFLALMKHHRFTTDDVREVTLAAISDSWMAEEKKTELAEEFRSDEIWLGEPAGAMEGGG